jgi:hypothetical protein
MLLSFWLLLLVIAAAILLGPPSRAGSKYFPDPANTSTNRNPGHVDPAAARPTHKKSQVNPVDTARRPAPNLNPRRIYDASCGDGESQQGGGKALAFIKNQRLLV